MKITPYNHQQTCINALFDYFKHEKGNPLIVAPGGSGKSVIIACFIKEVLRRWPGQRILMLTARRELISQNLDKMVKVWPLAPVGVHSAGLNKHDVFQPIIFAGIQSVYKKAMQLGRFNLILIDEVQEVNVKQCGMYRRFIKEATKINPKLRLIGLTATPFRTGSGDITHGKDAIFTDIAYEIEMLYLIKKGFLAPLIAKKVTEIDSSGFHVRAGEFIQKEVEQAFDHDDITQCAIDEMIKYGKKRKSWLAFGAGIAHAQHISDALNDRGIESMCVSSKTPKKERDYIIKSHMNGELRALCNASLLGVGYDAPQIDLIAILKSMYSPGNYVQTLVRGSRIYPSKEYCKILDFGGNVRRHGPVDKVKAWIPETRKKGEAPMKDCPACQSILPASTRICPDCGHEFEFEEKDKHEKTAGTEAILSTDEEQAKYTDTVDVSYINYCIHLSRKSGKNVLKVDYKGEYASILATDWICFDHSGTSRAKAIMWWKTRVKGLAIKWPNPSTVVDAMKTIDEIGIKEPSAITINSKGTYAEIISYDFSRKKVKPIDDSWNDDIPF